MGPRQYGRLQERGLLVTRRCARGRGRETLPTVIARADHGSPGHARYDPGP